MGTPDFAVPTLRALLELTQLSVVAVVTQPDRPVGRKQILTPPPIKVLAQDNSITVLQPEKLRDQSTVEQIKNLSPELIVVAAYGQIIPKAILEMPKFGAINVHASLLPKYRGASPIQAVIAAGERETGVTIMLMDELLDHGPILSQGSIKIDSDETGGSLFEKLSTLGAELLASTTLEWIAGRIETKEQAHTQATSTKLLKRDSGKIDWHQSAESIERMVRAYNPWPGTWTTWQHGDKPLRISIVRASGCESRTSNPDGTVFKTDRGFAVQCGIGALEILELQLEGKRAMNAQDFLKGHPAIVDTMLK